MITLYAALGNIQTIKGAGGGLKPVVIRKGVDFAVNPSEFTLWTSSMWSIYHYDELKKAYLSRGKDTGMRLMEYDAVLQQLIGRKLLISGAGETGIDALYDLMENAFLAPFQIRLAEKLTSFARLTFIDRVPFRVTRHLFDRPKFSRVQNEIWKLICQQTMSTAELIRCIEMGVRDVSTGPKIVDAIYKEESGVDYLNVGIHSRLSEQQFPVLEAAAQLYLDKMVSLDIC